MPAVKEYPVEFKDGEDFPVRESVAVPQEQIDHLLDGGSLFFEGANARTIRNRFSVQAAKTQFDKASMRPTVTGRDEGAWIKLVPVKE